MKLEHTTLVIANNVQRQAIYRAVWQAWELPNGVSEAQGVANCRFGETLATADDGRLIYWALVARADTGGPDVLSAARTLRRDAKKRDTGDGQVADVTSYVITSVVTPPHHQKKGYATHLLSLLHYALSLPHTLPPFPTSWGSPPAAEYMKQDATFSTLWSDVGPDFYRRIQIGRAADAREGWVAKFDEELGWDVPSDDALVTAAAAPLLPNGWSSFPWVTSIPSSLLTTHTFRTLLTAPHPSSTRTIIYDPPTSPGILHWIARCKRFFPPDLVAKERPYGGVHHAYVHEENGAVIVAVPDLSPGDIPTLRVSLLALDPTTTTAGEGGNDIIRSAFDLLTAQARRYGCRRVEAMQVPPEISDKWKTLNASVQIRNRKEHLCALAWYGEEPVQDVHAIGGEYYSWA